MEGSDADLAKWRPAHLCDVRHQSVRDGQQTSTIQALGQLLLQRRGCHGTSSTNSTGFLLSGSMGSALPPAEFAGYGAAAGGTASSGSMAVLHSLPISMQLGGQWQAPVQRISGAVQGSATAPVSLLQLARGMLPDAPDCSMALALPQHAANGRSQLRLHHSSRLACPTLGQTAQQGAYLNCPAAAGRHAPSHAEQQAALYYSTIAAYQRVFQQAHQQIAATAATASGPAQQDGPSSAVSSFFSQPHCGQPHCRPGIGVPYSSESTARQFSNPYGGRQADLASAASQFSLSPLAGDWRSASDPPAAASQPSAWLTAYRLQHQQWRQATAPVTPRATSLLGGGSGSGGRGGGGGGMDGSAAPPAYWWPGSGAFPAGEPASAVLLPDFAWRWALCCNNVNLLPQSAHLPPAFSQNCDPMSA